MYGKKGLACGKLNHFKAVCRSQARSKVHDVAVDNPEIVSVASSDDLNLDTVMSSVNSSASKLVNVFVKSLNLFIRRFDSPSTPHSHLTRIQGRGYPGGSTGITWFCMIPV